MSQQTQKLRKQIEILELHKRTQRKLRQRLNAKLQNSREFNKLLQSRLLYAKGRLLSLQSQESFHPSLTALQGRQSTQPIQQWSISVLNSLQDLADSVEERDEPLDAAQQLALCREIDLILDNLGEAAATIDDLREAFQLDNEEYTHDLSH